MDFIIIFVIPPRNHLTFILMRHSLTYGTSERTAMLPLSIYSLQFDIRNVIHSYDLHTRVEITNSIYRYNSYDLPHAIVKI